MMDGASKTQLFEVQNIQVVKPCRIDEDDNIQDSLESNAYYTMIQCDAVDSTTDEKTHLILLLPRGPEACKNTFLLADAIREE